MNLGGIADATRRVLQRISKSELEAITMPALRAKVAVEMGVSEEQLKGSEAKTALMEAFQEFLLNGEANAKANNGDANANAINQDEKEKYVDDEEVINNDPAPAKPAKKTKKASGKSDSKAESKARKDTGRRRLPKPAIHDSDSGTTEDDKTAHGNKSKSSGGRTRTEAQIERLKSYIFKCGVRRVWKRELEGMSEKECIAHLNQILLDVGMEGRPTLEKCREIKQRREFEAELREIDVSNIIDEPRRRSTAAGAIGSRRQVVVEEEEGSDASSEDDNGDENEVINWKSFGDPEDSE